MAGSAILDEDMILAIAREQVGENLRYALAASIAGIFNACVAVAVFWSAELAAPLLTWLGAIVAGGLLRVRNIRDHASRSQTMADVARQRYWIEFIAAMNGVVWGVGVALGALVADPAQYVLVVILCSGMMGASVTTYTSMAGGATLYILPLALGGLVSLWLVEWAPAVAGTILLACYVTLLISGSIRREKRFEERVRAREEARRHADTVRLLLNDFESQASDWLWQIDANGLIHSPTARFAQAASASIALLERCELASLFDPSPECAKLLGHLRRRESFRNLTLRLTIGGEPRWWTLCARPADHGGMRGVASDVTAQKRAEQRAEDLAQVDSLTGLASRSQFIDTLHRKATRDAGAQPVALICLDVDGFKRANEMFGFSGGDRLLCDLAARLQQSVGEFDLVARTGDDEFAVLVEGTDCAARSTAIADSILASLVQPFSLYGSMLNVSASIGISIGSEPATLLKDGYRALHSARSTRGNHYVVFGSAIPDAA